MKTIIGIGNPGKMYKYTRHNAGVMLCEHLVNSSQSTDHRVFISDKFMNDSGQFVKRIFENYRLKTENLYVVHDDLDLRLGEYKITKKAPKVHNGINSINESLKSEDYWKIRIGVDNRDPDNRIAGEKYVLEKFTSEELEILQDVFVKIENDL